MDEKELIIQIEKQRNIMVSVSTGGPRIQDINNEYKSVYYEIDSELKNLGLANPNPYPDLWEWYGRWSSGDLPSYQSRREFLVEMFNPLLKELRIRSEGGFPSIPEKPTGWPRVDRTIGEIRKRLSVANTEEQFQAIGLLCREAIISIAQSVYDPNKHPSIDDKLPSETDAKRMLESYIESNLAGKKNEAPRRYVKSAYNLANDLQHKRTADFRRAALCVESTASLVNIISIISGRRDP